MLKIGNICKFQSGGTPSKKNPEYYNGNIPWITTVSLIDNYIDENNAVEYITSEAIKNSAAKIVPKDSIMIGTRVGIGKTAINCVEMSTSQDIVSLIDIDENRWNKCFLCLFFKSKKKYLLSQSRGATIKGIKIDTISNLELPTYSIDEQKEIVSTLDTLQSIITHRRTQIEKLDLLVKARFVEMFGDCEKNIRLGDCCEVHARIGWQALTRDEHMQTGEYMLVTGTDFINGRVNYDTCVYVAKERFDMDPHIILKENDVLITKDGSIGKVAVVHNLPKPATLNGGIFVVRPDDKFNKEYISYVFKGPLFERFVDLSKTGATIKHLNQKHLVEFTIPLPSIEKQNLFAVFSNQIDKSKIAVQKTLDEAQLLFDSLMQEYFG